MAIMQECIPAGVLPPRHRKLPWLNKGIIQSMRRRKLSKKAKKNSPEGVHKYKRARNKVVTLMRSAKKEHFHELNPHNVKQFWKSIKVLNKYNSSIPTQSQGSTILSTDVEKAAALNSFFSECFNRNVPPIIPLDLNQLSAHLSGWLAFLLLPSCWNQ